MDSLNTKLSPVDEYNFNCTVHDKIYIGVCGNSLCKEKRLLCMECVNSKETCIRKESHELISLSEFFYRFFLKQENKSIDLDYLNATIEQISDIDKNDVLKGLKEFHKLTLLAFNKFSDVFKEKFELQFTEITKKYEKNYAEIDLFIEEFGSQSTKDFIHVLNEFILKNKKFLYEEINLDELITSIYKKSEDLTDKNEIFAFVIDSNNFKNLNERACSLIKYSKFQEYLDNYDIDKLEKKIDKYLSVLEKSFDDQLEKLEEKITIEKGNISYMKPSTLQKFLNSPENFIFIKDITETAHISNSIDSVFCAFKTLKGDSLIAWGSPSHNIEIFDLKQNKISKTIKNAHTTTIFSCRNYVDLINTNDLIISSSYDRSVKVWSCKDNWNNIVNIQNASSGNYIYSVSVLSEKHERKNYIISSCPCEYMKVWDYQGKLVREFGTNTESTYFIDCWYYNKNETYYIINANSVDVKSYFFKTGLLYKTYKTTPNNWHMSAVVNQLQDVCQLIESDGSGTVRIWDFHTAALLKSISLLMAYNLRGICMWNDKYLFGAGSDCNIKLLDLKNGTHLKDFKSHTKTACSIQKIVHPQYGECFITHALDGKLKLWAKGS